MATAAVQAMKRGFFGISWKRMRSYIPSMILMVMVFMVPNAAAAGDFGGLSIISTKFNDAITSLKAIVKVLAILGIMIGAIGMFLGNAGDGVKKLLVISIGLAIAMYASDYVGNFSN